MLDLFSDLLVELKFCAESLVSGESYQREIWMRVWWCFYWMRMIEVISARDEYVYLYFLTAAINKILLDRLSTLRFTENYFFQWKTIAIVATRYNVTVVSYVIIKFYLYR